MEITINKLAQLAKVSTRTIRYYDEIDLLKPNHIKANGYRIYGQAQIDQLQQIMLYKELDMPLDDIKKIMCDSYFDPNVALHKHLLLLKLKQKRLELLISNVEKTIASNNGEIKMENKEKFEGFKHQLIEKNELQYGAEIRKKYGNKIIEKSNTKIKQMSPEQYEKIENLTEELEQALKLAAATNDPSSTLAQKVCRLHKDWLCLFWEEGVYSKESHLMLAEMYVTDERFKKYYDKIFPNCAEFLNAALKVYYHL